MRNASHSGAEPSLISLQEGRGGGGVMVALFIWQNGKFFRNGRN
jgi:hypothetical protein